MIIPNMESFLILQLQNDLITQILLFLMSLVIICRGRILQANSLSYSCNVNLLINFSLQQAVDWLSLRIFVQWSQDRSVLLMDLKKVAQLPKLKIQFGQNCLISLLKITMFFQIILLEIFTVTTKNNNLGFQLEMQDSIIQKQKLQYKEDILGLLSK